MSAYQGEVMNNRRKLVIASAVWPIFGAALCAACSVAIAQDYPARPIRIIVGFSAGGPNDLAVRPIAQKLYEMLGQPVVIDYRTGANGIIAGDLVAKAPPDGYTLLTTASAFTINPSIYAKLPFDLLKDLAPISLIANSDIVFVTNPRVPGRTLQEFVALAKTRAGDITYGSSGIGSSLHLGGELLKLAANIRMLHVPYKGAAPAMADIIGGHLDAMFIPLPPAIPHVTAGKLRALGMASLKRAAGLPDVRTFIELGYADFVVDSSYGLMAPAGTPRAVIEKLNAAVAKATQMPDLKERYAGLGLEPLSNTIEQYAEYLRNDIEKWRKVAISAKVEPQ
jgi:tripartite-type tricarboxylate transporter receptor subunit TctC